MSSFKASRTEAEQEADKLNRHSGLPNMDYYVAGSDGRWWVTARRRTTSKTLEPPPPPPHIPRVTRARLHVGRALVGVGVTTSILSAAAVASTTSCWTCVSANPPDGPVALFLGGGVIVALGEFLKGRGPGA